MVNSIRTGLGETAAASDLGADFAIGKASAALTRLALRIANSEGDAADAVEEFASAIAERTGSDSLRALRDSIANTISMLPEHN